MSSLVIVCVDCWLLPRNVCIGCGRRSYGSRRQSDPLITPSSSTSPRFHCCRRVSGIRSLIVHPTKLILQGIWFSSLLYVVSRDNYRPAQRSHFPIRERIRRCKRLHFKRDPTNRVLVRLLTMRKHNTWPFLPARRWQ